jgi:uncharacterized protein YkvS
MLDQAITFILRNSTNEDLNAIGEAVKMRRQQLTKQNVRKLSVGDTVSFNGRRGPTKGVVKKINIKYVIVDAGFAGSWRVPANMLTQETA